MSKLGILEFVVKGCFLSANALQSCPRIYNKISGTSTVLYWGKSFSNGPLLLLLIIYQKKKIIIIKFSFFSVTN